MNSSVWGSANVFSVDVEDWFHVLYNSAAPDYGRWASLEFRVRGNTELCSASSPGATYNARSLSSVGWQSSTPSSSRRSPGVVKLPAEFMRISAGRIVERRLWYTLPQCRLKPKRLRADDAVASVQEALHRAVQRQLVREMRAAVEHSRAGQPMLDFLRGIPEDRTPMERMLAMEQRFFLADHNLVYTDKMSMAAAVEVRVPFLDTDLVELAARIPDGLKQRGRVGKWVLKKAMEPSLPRDVIYRPKTGFGAPLRRWMRYELRELLSDLLSEKSPTPPRTFRSAGRISTDH